MELLGVVSHENLEISDDTVIVLARPYFNPKHLRDVEVRVDVPAGGTARGKVLAAVGSVFGGLMAGTLVIVKGDWRTPIIGASVYLAEREEVAA